MREKRIGGGRPISWLNLLFTWRLEAAEREREVERERERERERRGEREREKGRERGECSCLSDRSK